MLGSGRVACLRGCALPSGQDALWRALGATLGGAALADRIANDRRRRAELGLPNVDYITALLERMVAAGTLYVRSHTDVDADVGLRGIEAVQRPRRGCLCR